MRTALTDDEFIAETDGWSQSAFRLEVKRSYLVVGERHAQARYKAGKPPALDDYSKTWLDDIARKAGRGAHLTRVRIVDTPMTDYQRFLQWNDELNRQAGELIHYLDRAIALAAGLPARADQPDWWLLDDTRVLVLTHDQDGKRTKVELTTERKEVQQARLWRDLAITATTARREPSK